MIIKRRRLRLVRYLSYTRKEIHTECWLRILKGRDNLEDLDIEGRIILKLIYWNLPQSREESWALVNKVINDNELIKTCQYYMQ
jgi:hypothetical protein